MASTFLHRSAVHTNQKQTRRQRNIIGVELKRETGKVVDEFKRDFKGRRPRIGRVACASKKAHTCVPETERRRLDDASVVAAGASQVQAVSVDSDSFRADRRDQMVHSVTRHSILAVDDVIWSGECGRKFRWLDQKEPRRSRACKREE